MHKRFFYTAEWIHGKDFGGLASGEKVVWKKNFVDELKRKFFDSSSTIKMKMEITQARIIPQHTESR